MIESYPALYYVLTVSSLCTVGLLTYIARYIKGMFKQLLEQSERNERRSKFNLYVLDREGLVDFETATQEDVAPTPPARDGD